MLCGQAANAQDVADEPVQTPANPLVAKEQIAQKKTSAAAEKEKQIAREAKGVIELITPKTQLKKAITGI
ncbi:MAG: hypothetical protein IT292_07275 [Deltaproteobacteria bacterium]|nr:hypothetical protein [Deltaproteobacteria bacterium]